jgi:hypothetical protein
MFGERFIVPLPDLQSVSFGSQLASPALAQPTATPSSELIPIAVLPASRPALESGRRLLFKKIHLIVALW